MGSLEGASFLLGGRRVLRGADHRYRRDERPLFRGQGAAVRRLRRADRLGKAPRSSAPPRRPSPPRSTSSPRVRRAAVRTSKEQGGVPALRHDEQLLRASSASLATTKAASAPATCSRPLPVGRCTPGSATTRPAGSGERTWHVNSSVFGASSDVAHVNVARQAAAESLRGIQPRRSAGRNRPSGLGGAGAREVLGIIDSVDRGVEGGSIPKR